jgi:hypothetical protein
MHGVFLETSMPSGAGGGLPPLGYFDLPGDAVIWIAVAGLLESKNRRAIRWHEGRVGAKGELEIMYCLGILQFCPDVLADYRPKGDLFCG